jgi:hypothetical protein
MQGLDFRVSPPHQYGTKKNRHPVVWMFIFLSPTYFSHVFVERSLPRTYFDLLSINHRYNKMSFYFFVTFSVIGEIFADGRC